MILKPFKILIFNAQLYITMLPAYGFFVNQWSFDRILPALR